MTSAVRERVSESPVGAWIRPSEFGGGNAVEQALSRLARDPRGPVVRAAKGLYYKSGPADPTFGKRKPTPIEVAAEVARGQGVGPAGVFAAAYLGLTTQVAPRPILSVAGPAPTGVSGVEWQTRNNAARALLDFAEVAVLEVLSIYPNGVEAEWPEVVARVDGLRDAGRIDLDRIRTAVASERRKPELREHLDRLLADLEVA